MARYRKVDTRIWNDQKFNSLSDRAKLLFFFLLTHPHLTALGAMRISVLGLAGELGWPEESLREGLREAFAKGMVKYDEKALFMWLPNFLKYNQPESPNVVKSWGQALDYLPECKLKIELITQVRRHVESLPEGFREALPIPFAKGMPNQEQEQEQEQKQEQEQENTTRPKRKISAPVVPTKSENQVVVITIPLNNHNEFEIHEDEVEQWQNLYPGIDVVQELRNIRGWNLANPIRRKTKSGVLKHINTWLAKAQNKSRISPARAPPSSSTSNLFEFNKSVAHEWLRRNSIPEEKVVS